MTIVLQKDDSVLCEELIEHIQHRLIVLDLALKESFASRKLSKRQLKKRSHLLRRLEEDLGHLAAHCSKEETRSDSPNGDLPNISYFAPQEVSLCARYFLEKGKLLDRQSRFSAKLLVWLRSISQGKMTHFGMVFRLSRLRRELVGLEQKISEVGHDDKMLRIILDKLLKQTGGKCESPASESAYDVIDALANLFAEIDLVTARMASLRSEIQREEAQVLRMVQWLEDHESIVGLAKAQKLSPPSPSKMAEIKGLYSPKDSLSANTREKHMALANTFWRKVVVPILQSER